MSLHTRQPKVSVISLVYNTGKHNLVAFDSLIKQSYANFEHIIIDDKSTDDSVQLIENWIKKNNHQCMVLKNEINLGITRTLNKALKHANGKYWAPLGDDIWMQDHLQTSIEILEQPGNENYGLLYSTLLIESGKDTDSKLWSIQNRLRENGLDEISIKNSFPEREEVLKIDKNIFYNCLFYCNIFHPVSAIYNYNITKELGFFDANLEFEDYDYAFKLSRKYDVLYCNNVSSIYKIHGGNFVLKRSLELNYGKIKTLLKYKPDKKRKDLRELRKKQIITSSKYILNCYIDQRKFMKIMKTYLKLGILYPVNFFAIKIILENVFKRVYKHTS